MTEEHLKFLNQPHHDERHARRGGPPGRGLQRGFGEAGYDRGALEVLESAAGAARLEQLLRPPKGGHRGGEERLLLRGGSAEAAAVPAGPALADARRGRRDPGTARCIGPVPEELGAGEAAAAEQESGDELPRPPEG